MAMFSIEESIMKPASYYAAEIIYFPIGVSPPTRMKKSKAFKYCVLSALRD